MKGLALHITSADLRLTSRIDRITQFIRAQGLFENVEVAGVRTGDLASLEIHVDGRVYRRFGVRRSLREMSRLTRAFDFLIWYAQVAAYYLPRRVDCVNAHTLSVLPLCWLLSKIKGCKLVYEPHELETETTTVRGIAKPILKFAERLFIRAADAVVLVNGAIADWYRQSYRLKRVGVVRNLPSSGPGEPLPRNYYADFFNFPASDTVFLYQGLLGPGRGIDLLLSAAKRIPAGSQFVFLGFGSETETIKEAARALPNVHYHPAVPPDVLLRYTGAADVTLMMIEDVSLSYRLCYPNKYCESLTAGVPVICSDFLWLRSEVDRYACGWSCSYDAGALCALIAGIDRASIAAKRSGADAWTRENNWGNEEKVLCEIYAGLLQKGEHT